MSSGGGSGVVVAWKSNICTEDGCYQGLGEYIPVCKRVRDRDREIRDGAEWTAGSLFQNAEFGPFYKRINLTQLSLIHPLRP